MGRSVEKVLIIGGGFSGMVTAISLRRKGVDVVLLEKNAEWRAEGAGISLGGSTMRLFHQLGMLEDFKKVGAAHEGVEIRGPDDSVMATLPTPGLGPGMPGIGGAMRPALARMFADKVVEEGVDVRLGTTYTDIDLDAGEVTFTDGSVQTFDLIVAADGLWSKTRDLIFPEAPCAEYLGQQIWRAVIDRPAELPTVAMWMGPHLKAGINHVSETQSYLFLTEDQTNKTSPQPDGFIAGLKTLLANFPSPVLARIREALSEDSCIDVRPAEKLLLQNAWHRGRVVLIGDATHATTPHLASGALIGMEDGVVLAEEVAKGGSLEACLDRFFSRRFDRCKMVVENSRRLAEIEVTGGDKNEHAEIMRSSGLALAQPI